MVFLPETDPHPHPEDNNWQATIRDYVQSTTPYRGSRMYFERSPPPALNAVDQVAPMALLFLTLAFFAFM